MKKRFLAALLVFVMMLTLLPTTALAGKIPGDGFEFDDSNGKLTISSNDGTDSWRSNSYFTDKSIITSVVIQSGVTSIEKDAFSGCTGLTSITILGNVSIKENVFNGCTGLASLSLPAAPPTVTNANAFTGCPATRSLTLVNESGVELTGAALNDAITAYESHTGYDSVTEKWYGWTLPTRSEEGDITIGLSAALNVEGGTLVFENDGVNPWVVEVTGYPERTAVKSHIEGKGSTSTTITLTAQAYAGEFLMYDYYVSSETYYDVFRFYVNGTEVHKYTGTAQNEFLTAVYEIPSDGTYTFTWTYSKDISVNSGEDAAWLDNIELGDPPELESIIFSPSDILMRAGIERSVTVSPIPSLANLSGISWTSDDESVATVAAAVDDTTGAPINGRGVITAHSLGTATITATSAEGYTAELTVEVTDEFFAKGYLVYNSSDLPNGLYSFDLIGRTSTKLGAFNSAVFAMEYIHGTLYGYDDSHDYYLTADAETLEPEYSPNETAVFDMAYDHSTGTLYGLMDDNNVRSLATIDPATGEAAVIAPITDTNDKTILTLACSTGGTLYGVSIEGSLYSIDPATAVASHIGSTGVSPNYVQSMAYDHNRGVLLWASCVDVNTCDIYAVNVETAAVEKLYPDAGEICGLYVEPVYDISFTAQPTANVAFTQGAITDSLTAAASVWPSGEAELTWYACDQDGVISGQPLGTGGTFAIPQDLAVGTYYYVCRAAFRNLAEKNSNVAAVKVDPTPTIPGAPPSASYYRLSFNTNGGGAVSSVTRAEGSTVNLSAYVPTREGYNFIGWYADEALTEPVTSVRLRTYTTVYAKWLKANSMENFTMDGVYNGFLDVDESLWYGTEKEGAVRDAVLLGIVEGYGDGKFGPEDELKISEAIKMACVVYSIFSGDGYDFTQGDPWYDVYVDYAIAKGIIGAEDFADYEAVCTRAEAAYIFAKALPETELAKISDLTPPDVAETDEYAAAIYLLYAAGVLRGNDELGTFDADGAFTRSQAAAIITRLALPEKRA